MKTEIMSTDQVKRTLRRLAHEVVERNRGVDSLEVVGIRRRGTHLAHALAEEIAALGNRDLQVHDLDTTPFRDDREGNDGVVEDQSTIHNSLADRDVILVDDVLFTGRTARAALDALIQHGRPRSIQFVVLVDRGHREYPIRPDYVGKTIPTRHRERVNVELNDGISVLITETA